MPANDIYATVKIARIRSSRFNLHVFSFRPSMKEKKKEEKCSLSVLAMVFSH